MKVEVLQEAEDELKGAIAYYEQIQPGLGIRLKEEARAVIQWVSLNPRLSRPRPNGYYRVNFKVFPYYIAYFIAADTIWILAAAHCRRRPEYWITRKPPSDL